MTIITIAGILAFLTLVFGMVLKVTTILLIPALVLAVCILLFGMKSRGLIPKQWICWILILLALFSLTFTLSFGIAKTAVNKKAKEAQVKTEETVEKTITLSNDKQLIASGEEIEIGIKSTGDIETSFLTQCDLKTVGAKSDLLRGITNGFVISLSEITQEEVKLWIEKDGVISNTLKFSISDYNDNKEEEEDISTEDGEPVKSVASNVAPKTVVIEKRVEVPVEKKVEVIKEVRVEVPIETPKAEATEPVETPKADPKPVPTQTPTPNYNYNGYYGDPTGKGSDYNYNSGYYGGYGDPTSKTDNYSYSGLASISGPKNVVAGGTYRYTISDISNFTLSKLEYPSRYVTAKKTGSNTFSLTFDDDYTGWIEIDYNDNNLRFRINVEAD